MRTAGPEGTYSVIQTTDAARVQSERDRNVHGSTEIKICNDTSTVLVQDAVRMQMKMQICIARR